MKSKLTKDELVEFRTKERLVSRVFFVFALLFMVLLKEGYIAKVVAPYLGFGAFFIWLLFLTGREYRKYYFLITPPLAVLCTVIGGVKGFSLAFLVSFVLFFLSLWLGKRSYEKQKGIAHSW